MEGRNIGEPVSPLYDAAEDLELGKVLALFARRCLTTMAAERHLHLPFLSDPQAIQAALAEMSAYRNLLDRGEDAPLENFDPVDDALDKLRIAGSILAPAELVALARIARIARKCAGFFRGLDEGPHELLQLASDLTSLKKLEDAVSGAIDTATHDILDSASPELRRIRKNIERSQAGIRSQLQKMLQKLAQREMLQEQLITMREGRLVMMVKGEFRRRIDGIVHDQSASGQTVFVEPVETVQLNNEVRRLQAEERAEIERILAQLSALAAEDRQPLLQNAELLIHFDCIRARAVFARDYNGNAANVNSEGKIVVYSARHPLLIEKYQDINKVVPLDLKLSPEQRGLIISGPNAGGKTVAMKTTGLAVLMTRLGLPISASPDSEIGLLGQVFVDIGDRQSIENDLSTFTSHMSRLRGMLEQANSQDLVLIDEIGSGTDPEEGTAISLSALETLQKNEVRFIITTHHGALKAFAHREHGIENGSMVFDLDSLSPTYQFQAGIPGSSYAFEIAGRAGLSAEIISRARDLAGSAKVRSEALISDLQKKLQEQQALAEKNKLEQTRLQGLAKLYKDRADKLKENERVLREKALADADAILQRANATVEEAIRNIRESQASKEAIREARENLNEQKQQVKKEKSRVVKTPVARQQTKSFDAASVEPGTTAWWPLQQSEVIILAKPDQRGQVQISAGSLKLKVKLADLEPIRNKQRKQRAQVNVDGGGKVLQDLDLRGMRAEEAVDRTDQFLSEAIVYGWDRVRIVHGKGTGALREAIAEFLRQHPAVAGFKAAPLGQGDLGVTVVEFK